MVAKGAAPHREVIPISMKDIAGPAHIVRGGRWLLLATHAGPIVYYDLEAETPIAQVLTPEHERGHLVSMAVDMDSTSPTLKFNLAASRKFVDFTAHVSTATVEVWQVNLILDGYERGIGLRAERLAMFDQEPPGECRSISLLGEQLAMAIFYSNHHTVYTVVVSWRSVSGPDYPKRMLRPSTEAMCLLQPDILLSTPCDTIDFTSCLSIPEVTTLPSHFLEIPETMPFLAVVPFQGFTPRPKSLSDCTIYSDSFRFVVHANRGMHTIIVRPKTDGTYHIETHKIMNTPEALHNLQIPVSGNLLPTWSQSGELRLQQFSWTEDEASSFPVARFKVSPRYEPSFQLFDIVSGRIIVPDAGGLSVFHLAPPLIPPITMRFGPWGNH
ncbi:hypothetical protein BDN72DRAFT_903535 [Pluteus cervinus]|uniref:Uncharacterized protein n=1 Tax=Pluteus cervinus TaxID=181527 RepID=A0ACD3A912_9AGAR|nr:hypothetical protein BDN72DRAFT_903535 [Pluteus cervinus]